MIAHALPPDAVKVLVAYLAPLLDTDVWVGSRMTTAVQADYARTVSIRRDGGAQIDQTQDVARIGINVTAADEFAAVTLARTVQWHILQSPDGVVILGAETMSGPTVVPDAGALARVYLTFEVVLAGE